MSLLSVSACRIFHPALPRQRLFFTTCRFLSSQHNNAIIQAQQQHDKEQKQQFKADYPSSQPSPGRRRRYHYYLLSIATGALIGTIYALRQVRKHEGILPEYVANAELLERKAMEARPLPPPITKHVTFNGPQNTHFPFKLTLYQYITCPFCCKVRAYLDYRRIPYDVVEVNSVMRRETRWSLYEKVPILVVENDQMQLNDSSVIISAIESYLRMPTKTFRNVGRLYQAVIEKDAKGNLSFNFPNKYFLVEPLLDDRLDPIAEVQTEKSKRDAVDAKKTEQTTPFWSKVFGSATEKQEHGLVNVGAGTVATKPPSIPYTKSSEQYRLERKWREWVDAKFVHTLSPNVYCTFRQSLNTFRWFSQAGDWEQIFPWYQRWFIVYAGAIVMRVVAGRLKRKYNLNDDVRISLYECGNEWMKAVGTKDFLGGSEPNLADMNVYGVLTAIQGCQAFQDLMEHTNMQAWFERMKHLIEQHRVDTPVRAKN